MRPHFCLINIKLINLCLNETESYAEPIFVTDEYTENFQWIIFEVLVSLWPYAQPILSHGCQMVAHFIITVGRTRRLFINMSILKLAACTNLSISDNHRITFVAYIVCVCVFVCSVCPRQLYFQYIRRSFIDGLIDRSFWINRHCNALLMLMNCVTLPNFLFCIADVIQHIVLYVQY